MLSLGVGTAAAAGAGPPSGMVGIPDGNVADIRADGIARNVTESDLEGAVYVSDRAATTEVSLVTIEQADEIARGASPSDVAHEAVCSSPAAGKNPRFECDRSMALVISDDVHHEGRRVAVRTSVIREALGWVPESLTIANNETGEQWRAPASVKDGWLVASVEHFSSNSVTWTGTVDLSSPSATDGATMSYEIRNKTAASDPQGTLTGTEAVEWDNVTATDLGNGETLAVNPAGHEIRGANAGEPELVLTGEGFNRSQTETGTAAPGTTGIAVDTDGTLELMGPASGDPDVTLTGQKPVQTKNSQTFGSTDTTFSNPPTYLTFVSVTLKNTASGSFAHADVYLDTNSQTITIASDAGFDPGVEKTLTKTVSLQSGSSATIRVEAGSAGADKLKTKTLALEGEAPQNVGVTFSDGTSVSFGDFSDGQTKSQAVDLPAGESVSSFDTSGSNGTLNWSLAYRERQASEDPAADVDGDGIDECAVSGLLEAGETKTCQVASLGPEDDTTTVSLSSGTVGVEARLQEVTKTKDATVTLNSQQIASVMGTLADGETHNFSASSSVLQDGWNTVNISVGDGSLSTDAPTPAVGFEMTHSAMFNQTVTYDGEEWTERYEVSRRWSDGGANASLTIPLGSNVVAIRDLAFYRNGTKTAVSWSDFKENSSTLEIGLGNVDPNAKTRVVTNASKVQTHNLSLRMERVTPAGQQLDSRFKLTSVGENAYIAVGPTANGDRIHYLFQESWSASDYAVVDSSGSQRIYVPYAKDGSTASVTYLPTAASVDGGDVRLSVEQTGNEPRLKLKPGPSGSGSTVTLTHHATQSGTTYYLKAIHGDSTSLLDSEVAQSPVTLEAGDDAGLVGIFAGDGGIRDPGSGDEADTTGSGMGASIVGSSLFVVVAVVLLTLAWFASQRWGSGSISTRTYLLLSAGVIGVFGLEILSGALVQGIVSALAAFLGGATEAWPLIILVGGGLAAYWLSTRNEDASTPEKVTNVDFNLRNRGK